MSRLKFNGFFLNNLDLNPVILGIIMMQNTMQKNKGLITLIGFVLVSLGFMALILSIVGVKFAFLLWIDKPGPLFGFIVRLLMIIGGFTLVYLAQSNFKGE